MYLIFGEGVIQPEPWWQILYKALMRLGFQSTWFRLVYETIATFFVGDGC